jgi:hypothetical protein
MNPTSDPSVGIERNARGLRAALASRLSIVVTLFIP